MIILNNRDLILSYDFTTNGDDLNYNSQYPNEQSFVVVELQRPSANRPSYTVRLG